MSLYCFILEMLYWTIDIQVKYSVVVAIDPIVVYRLLTIICISEIILIITVPSFIDSIVRCLVRNCV